jgi:hydrogenase expression/formation protein HypE
MHDPTEGGLAAGLHELALASNVGIRVDRGAVLWFEPGLAVCDTLGADPWSTLASGTLLAAFPPAHAATARAGLARHGYAAAAIGVAKPGSGVGDADGQPIPWPARDEVDRLLA